MSTLGEKLRQMAKDEPEKLKQILSQLTEEEAEAIIYDWEGIWARPNQLVDDNWPESVILFMAGRGFGKLVCNETPVLTYDRGFVAIKDLKVGDTIFDEAGKPTKILKTFDALPQKAYRLHFSDGTHIDCCDEHQWVTWTHRDRKQFLRNTSAKEFPENWPSFKGDILKPNRYGVTKVGEYGPKQRTTQEIVDTFRQNTKRKDLNHCIPTCSPVQIQRKPLRVDPYVFGYWIGDGTANSSSFTCDIKDQPNLVLALNKAGYKIGSNKCNKTVSALGLITDLKAIGAENKKIPDEYLFNSTDVRLAFLQGMMDSDGFIGYKGSHVEFCSKTEEHANAVMFLARSLGEKPRMYTGRATLNGTDYGVKYRVCWRPSKVVPFRLERKAKKCKFGENQSLRNHHRMIVDYEEIDIKPMRCLTVDSPNSMFLVGEALIPTHNTRVGAEIIRRKARNPENRITIVAPTTRDVIDTCVLGDSGLMNVCPPKERPIHEPSKSRVVFPNGCVVSLMSAETPERARGDNRSHIWGDEIGSWPDKDMFDQLMLSLRKGESKFYGTTTPRANDIIIHLYKHAVFNNDPPQKGKFCRIITGSTYDNIHNLSGAFKDTIIASYEGTRLGRQELEGVLLLDAEGALWKTDIITRQTLKEGEQVPPLKRVCIGVDPAVSTGKNSDKTGIVVSGLGEDDKGYVLEDHTGQYTPEGWVKKVLQLYDVYSTECATSIVVEKNQGGMFIQEALERARPFLPVDYTFSSRSKLSRAEPIALMYEQGKIFHAKSFNDLEREMTSYEGKPREKSPDHMDAMVFSLYGCLPLKNKVTKNFELII